MRPLFLTLLGHAGTSMAFPAIAALALQPQILPRQVLPRQSLPSNLPLSADEGNSGPIPSLAFDPADQFVNVAPGSANEYVAPLRTDERGPCPGLNAAANHGFLPHNGIPNIPQTIAGLEAAYGLGPEFGAALAVIAIALTGDPIAETWSIGGSFSPGIPILDGLLTNPDGISYSHNTYESDASIVRNDAYLNHGDAYSVNVTRFEKLYFSATNYTLDVLRDFNLYSHDFSVENNPYYFSAPFAGLVPPIAHHFVVNLFSNHSEEYIQGYLDRDILKTFFAISGPDNALVWNPGQEQIPQNWYRRPSVNPYGVVPAFADVAILATKYPQVVQFGGNTGTTNSFVGVNPGDITGGVLTAQTLLEGDNFGCFFFQAAQQGIPSVLKGIISDLAPIISLVNSYISPVLDVLNCPALNTFDESAFYQFPGYSYDPTQPAK